MQEITNILSQREKTLLCKKMCQFIQLIFHTYSQPAKTTRDWHLSTLHAEFLEFLHFSRIWLTSLNYLPLFRVNECVVSNKPALWNKLWLDSCFCTGVSFAQWQTKAIIIALLLSDLHTKPKAKKERQKKWRRQQQRRKQPHVVFWPANGITMIKKILRWLIYYDVFCQQQQC